ncbi:MAG: tetratricopeptide repeat-containing protein [Verrucomicrobia bacterium]|nr:tetratricopeptide repeat-containing protein [Verrucomicrobiota bacterium]
MNPSDPGYPYRIFISRVTGEFGKVSAELASDLRKKGVAGKIQIDFRQEEGTATTLDKLEKYVREADAVIALVGVQSGSYPPEAAARKWAHLLPDGITRATYTQWEVHFARAYTKRLSPYFGFRERDGTILYPAESAPEPATDDPAGKNAHVLWLTDTLGLDRQYFTSADSLCRQVLTESWPEFPRYRPNNLPFNTIRDIFVGRDDFLAEIRSGLDAARAAGQHDPNHVIWGLGGIGKTRAAIEYAWKNYQAYSALLCVSGETSDKLTENLAALTDVLGIPCVDGTPTSDRCAAVLRWLDANRGWLLIIDNVDDSAAAAAVQDRLPALSAGHVIITARFGAWKKDVIPLEMPLLSSIAAVRYLLAITDDQRRPAVTPEQDSIDAAVLASDVDHLALALETAAAYIARQHISFAGYRAALAAQPATVLDFLDAQTIDYKKNIIGAERTVAKTWLITMSSLSDPARNLLRVCSWFAPEPIPRTLLDYDPATQAPCDPGSVLGHLKELENYAFVHWDTAKDSFSLHRLVQEITRQQQPAPPPPSGLLTSLTWINGIFVGDPTDVRAWPMLMPLASHAHAIALHADERDMPAPTAHLLNQVGVLYYTKAQYAGAEPLYRRSLAIDEAALGNGHPNVARDLNNLAALLLATNSLPEAELLMRRALALDEAAFGPDHPKVARNLNNLAQLLQSTNRLEEAESLNLRALRINEDSFEPNHPAVAGSLLSMAHFYQATNRLAKAEPLMRRGLWILAAFTRSTGHEHPHWKGRIKNYRILLKMMGKTQAQVAKKIAKILEPIRKQ